MYNLLLKQENIVAKGEIARFKQFLLVSPCFQKAVCYRVYMRERVKQLMLYFRLKLNATDNREDGIYTCYASNRGGNLSKNFSHIFGKSSLKLYFIIKRKKRNHNVICRRSQT